MTETIETTEAQPADAPAGDAPAEPGVTRHGDLVTVRLARPIPAGDGEITAITLRQPDAGMLRGIKLIEVHELRPEAILALAARCSAPHVATAQLAAIKPPDLLRLSEAVTGFFTD